MLVLEDDQALCELVAEIVRDAGFTATIARRGAELPHRLDQFDALVANVVLPDVTGPEAARRLRAANPDVQVVFVTGWHEDELQRRRIELSGETVLQKPFTPAELLDALRDA